MLNPLPLLFTSRTERMKKVDIGVGIFLMALCVMVFVATEPYRAKSVFIYGPHFFPRLLGICLFILGGVLIWNAYIGKVLEQKDRIDPKGFIRMSIALGMSVIYVVLMSILGFAMSTFLFLLTMQTFFHYRSVVLRLIISVFITAIVYMIFHYILIIPLPEPIWA